VRREGDGDDGPGESVEHDQEEDYEDGAGGEVVQEGGVAVDDGKTTADAGEDGGGVGWRRESWRGKGGG